MAILFSNTIIVQTFFIKDNHNKIKHYSDISKRSKSSKNYKSKETKKYDGPNDFSILWNQILISWEKNIIQDSESLKRKYNEDLIRYLSKNILNHLDIIIYKFTNTDQKVISLYYDTYRLVYYDGLIDRLTILKQIIKEL